MDILCNFEKMSRFLQNEGQLSDDLFLMVCFIPTQVIMPCMIKLK